MYSPYLSAEEMKQLEQIVQNEQKAFEAEYRRNSGVLNRSTEYRGASAIVPNSAQDICPIMVGSHIPSITLPDRSGNLVNIQDTLSDKPAVLIFYRGGWCPYCNYQLSNMLLVEEYLDRLGYNIFGISPSSVKYLTSDTTPHFMKFQLLSDASMEISRQFGIAYRLDDDQHGAWKQEYNIDITQYSEQSHRQLPVPSVFIVDRTGTIRYRFVHPDYTIRLRTEKLLMMAEVFAHA